MTNIFSVAILAQDVIHSFGDGPEDGSDTLRAMRSAASEARDDEAETGPPTASPTEHMPPSGERQVRHRGGLYSGPSMGSLP